MSESNKNNAKRLLDELFAGGLPRNVEAMIRRWFFHEQFKERKEDALREKWDELVVADKAPGKEVSRMYALLAKRLGLRNAHAMKREGQNYLGRRRFAGIAAAAVILVILGSGAVLLTTTGILNKSSGEMADLISVTAPADGSELVTLPCGSEIRLREGSKLSYHTSNTAERKVELEGEAYFAVTKDETRPFTVHTRNIDIVVKGTEFNVSDNGWAEESRVTLYSGKIELAAHNSTMTLSKGKRFTLNNKSGSWSVEEMAEDITDPGWVKSNEGISPVTFDDILDDIGYKYKIDVINNRPDLANQKYIFTVTGQNVEETMSTLRMINENFNYRLEGGKLIIE